MKVWITKYALTDGITEIEKEQLEENPQHGHFVGGMILDGFQIEMEDIHYDKESAIAKAEEMRKRKIAFLKNQIEKLEKMKFEYGGKNETRRHDKMEKSVRRCLERKNRDGSGYGSKRGKRKKAHSKYCEEKPYQV